MRIDPVFTAPAPARSAGARVTFGPGARTAASPTTAMSHIAVQESLDGKNVEWMEHVTAEQYLK